MEVNGFTVATAALFGLAIGAFATGSVGGVVLPLLFVLACPLMVLFLRASTSGSRVDEGSADPGGQRDGTRAPGAREQARTARSAGTSAPVEGAARCLASSAAQRAPAPRTRRAGPEVTRRSRR